MDMASVESPVVLSSIKDRVEIAPGVHMPRLGLGTWKAHGDELENAIGMALEMGYRLLDTSPVYLNEREVGRAIARSGVPRQELFVTTKLDLPAEGIGSAHRAIEHSLHRLGLDYIDLYLIHWPRSYVINKTWSAMEDLQREGLTRAVGVSNFEVDDLEKLLKTASIVPAVNQIELNPLTHRGDVRAHCAEHGITVEAWAPVLQGSARDARVLVHIGEAHSKTAEQVSLRWLLQKGIVAIPKTVHEEWLHENADIYDFELSAEEIQEIDALGS